MAAGLMIAAGYLDLPLAKKLALMKMCDSADDRTRLALPGLDAVRIWCGVKRSQGLGLIAELKEDGLLMQVEAGYRGNRAVYKVFPSPGDEVHSLEHKRGKPCPGADKFRGPMAIPQDADEIAALLDVIDNRKPAAGSSRATPGKKKGSDSPDPNEKGPTPRTQTERVREDGPKPDPERVRSDTGKGPISPEKGSGPPDPYGFSTSVITTATTAAPVDNSPTLPGENSSSSSPTPDNLGTAAELLAELPPYLRPNLGTMRRLAPRIAERLGNGWLPADLIAAATIGITPAHQSPVGLLCRKLEDLDPFPPDAPPATPGAALASWCEDPDRLGCRPEYRWIEKPDGTVAKCPRCNPAHVTHREHAHA